MPVECFSFSWISSVSELLQNMSILDRSMNIAEGEAGKLIETECERLWPSVAGSVGLPTVAGLLPLYATSVPYNYT